MQFTSLLVINCGFCSHLRTSGCKTDVFLPIRKSLKAVKEKYIKRVSNSVLFCIQFQRVSRISKNTALKWFRKLVPCVKKRSFGSYKAGALVPFGRGKRGERASPYLSYGSYHSPLPSQACNICIVN